MKKENNTITQSFSESLKVITGDVVLDTSEIILDGFMQDDVLKELPIIKYAVTAYKVVDDIRGRMFVRKLATFINSFNSNLATQREVDKIKSKFVNGNRDEELSYISIVVDRYLDFNKPELIGKLYIAYLDEKISWSDFASYTEIFDKLLSRDLNYLMEKDEYVVLNNRIPSELLRLTGVGLMQDYQNDSPFQSYGGGIIVSSHEFSRVENKERIYTRSAFGKNLINALR